MLNIRVIRRLDRWAGLALAALALALYAATLLPGIGSGDTAELQRVPPTLGLTHPTGYPLYTLLGWLWSKLPLGATVAWRMNLLSAVTAAAACGVLYVIARAIGQWRAVAGVGALLLAASATFWAQATRAEVWGLAALLEAALILALLAWRGERAPLWLAGLTLGLALAHHRTSIWLIPGAALFVLLTRRPRWAELGAALLAAASGCLLYGYVLLHAPPWENRWQFLWTHASGNAAGMWLDLPRLRADGVQRPLGLIRDWIWPQLLPVGSVLALLGAARLVWRDPALAALLLVSYALLFAFCTVYYAGDVEVFLIPGYLIAALLAGEGAMLLLSRLPLPLGRTASLALLALPLLLVQRNLPQIRAANGRSFDLQARATLAQPLPERALIIGDWEQIEPLHYLQAVEGRRPDVELQVGFVADAELQFLKDELWRGRQIFFLRPRPEIGLAQWPYHTLWQVGSEPPYIAVDTPADVRWEDGISLTGFTLDPGPFQPAEIVPVTVEWTATAAPSAGYVFFVHVVAPDGTVVAQHDRGPATTPTEQWQPGDQWLDLFGPTLSPTTPPGRYRVRVGWYQYPSLRQLPRVDQPDPGAETILGEIEVAPPLEAR